VVVVGVFVGVTVGVGVGSATTNNSQTLPPAFVKTKL
jgi:hypothetical protein